jgi:hypothetical protein
MSLNLTINMAPNRDVITPLNIGEITYNDPEVLTTDIITEILVLDAPVPFQRFTATAPFNSVSQSNTYPELLPALQSGVTTDLISAGIGPMEQRNGQDMLVPMFVQANASLGVSLSDSWQALVNARIALREAASRVGFWKTGAISVESDWALPGSIAFGPQLDLFSRYNKWFASTSWLTASGISSMDSYRWPVLFIYVDRVAKRLYNVEGTIVAEYDSSRSGSDNLIITQATANVVESISRAEYVVTWSVGDPSVFDQFVIYLGGLPVFVVPADTNETYTVSPVYFVGPLVPYIRKLVLSKAFDVRVEGRKNGTAVVSATYRVITP